MREVAVPGLDRHLLQPAGNCCSLDPSHCTALHRVHHQQQLTCHVTSHHAQVLYLNDFNLSYDRYADVDWNETLFPTGKVCPRVAVSAGICTLANCRMRCRMCDDVRDRARWMTSTK